MFKSCHFVKVILIISSITTISDKEINYEQNIKNKQWFIQIEDKETHERMSICDNGLVYGTARGHRLGILCPRTINTIKDILTGKLDENGNEFTNITYANRINYMYNFKNNVYTKYYDNNTILRIRDDSRIERPIKVVGWRTTITILKLIKKQSSWKKLF